MFDPATAANPAEGRGCLPQRSGPSVVVDRRTKPGMFWTAVVFAGVVAAFSASVAILGPLRPPAGSELVGIDDGCLSVQAGAVADGALVEFRPCVGGVTAPYQFWTATAGRVVGTGSRKCLEVDGADGAGVDIRTCSGAPNQRWALQGTEIVGPGGSCLTVKGDGESDVSAVDLAPCNSQPNQSWRLHQPY
jgi:Ricin-type beta-trefoil lectin domain